MYNQTLLSSLHGTDAGAPITNQESKHRADGSISQSALTSLFLKLKSTDKRSPRTVTACLFQRQCRQSLARRTDPPAVSGVARCSPQTSCSNTQDIESLSIHMILILAFASHMSTAKLIRSSLIQTPVPITSYLRVLSLPKSLQCNGNCCLRTALKAYTGRDMQLVGRDGQYK